MRENQDVIWVCSRCGGINDHSVCKDHIYLCENCEHPVLIMPYLHDLPEDPLSLSVNG